MSKEIWLVGMLLLKYLSITWVDIVVLLLCYFKFGSTSKYGLCRPSKGPFYSIANTQGFFPMMDTGTFAKIKSGEIQVFIIILFKFFNKIWTNHISVIVIKLIISFILCELRSEHVTVRYEYLN